MALSETSKALRTIAIETRKIETYTKWLNEGLGSEQCKNQERMDDLIALRTRANARLAKAQAVVAAN